MLRPLKIGGVGDRLRLQSQIPVACRYQLWLGGSLWRGVRMARGLGFYGVGGFGGDGLMIGG